MEAEYVAYYLGSAMLNKGTTGLGVIQKPLRDKYFEFRKSADNKLGPEIGIRINPSGILLMFPGARQGEPNDEFYELPSVHFIEAVHFVTDKLKNKKMYGAFLPIDVPLDPSQEKLFEQVDKKFSHLAKIQHPPMLACVMRRPSGVRAVDCHMFVIPVVQDALHIVSMVHRFQERPVDPEFYNRPPINRRSEPDVIQRNLGHPPADPRQRNSHEDYELYRGRGLNLRQEHFIGNGSRPDHLRLEEPNRLHDQDQRHYPRDSPSPLDDARDHREFRHPQGTPSPRFENREFPGDRSSREYVKPSGAYVERDSFGREHEFDNTIPHDRNRPGHPGGDRFGYGQEHRADFGNRSGEFNREPFNRYDDRPSEGFRGPPPSWQNQRPVQRKSSRDYEDRSYPKHYDDRPEPQGARSPVRGQSPPRGQSSPRSPRVASPTPDDNVYSASNLESRLEASQNKPVAKVQPNRHAGVRVLPSLPIPGAKSHLKPVSPKNPDPPSKIEDKPPSYNFNTKAEEENPYDNNQDTRHFRQNRAQSERSPEVQRRDYQSRIEPRVKSEDYRYSSDGRRGKANVPKQWSYEEEKEKFLRKRDNDPPPLYKSQSAYISEHAHDIPEHGYPEHTESRTGLNMKDLEIADMFSNLRTSNQRRDVDFESSLGYLP